MRLDPFDKLYRLDQKIQEKFPNNFQAPKGGFVVVSMIVLAIYGMPAWLLQKLFPDNYVSQWYCGHWFWFVVYTLIAYVIYSFCRMFLETKTGG